MEATRPTRRLTAMAAFVAVRSAVIRAEELGVTVNASVVDAGGREIAFLRGDGAFLPSGQIARDKAYTALGFGLPTGDFYKALSGAPAVLAGITGQPNIAAFPGGLPIRVGNEVIGGIGVSGASAEQDDICARAGLTAIGLGQGEG
ncbi:heme-binding protein [Celeribacter sp. HF31]|uniref:GlcG/HbpS family heme-binding protein n=1 Tax=Celeribacter sp. HF31 TaxID=2721558 RepID=UPI0014311FB7|nr:heme-binding protein [Celeribacter sp. HF31]NIY80589.1 heme-binding protein [Celeribacter sp. HF31]